ncbi:hypothetical protein [Bradyrhizobium prioriisuperbiae]|uniref:AbiTii domain-containing protein n=1 Tax=Bradyrhizobium prioriisuperbiae TaxID=2854389 RepID=UPI0028EA39F7|nr:hypothetical protein [Bradyrhizobium prioritasuperba]
MSGLIDEIQRDAIDPKVQVSALLRKVKVAASKLNLAPTEKWVEQELSGYNEAPPEYRELKGHPKALNPFRGWIPIIFDEQELNEGLSSCSVRQSVASLEALIQRNQNSFVQFPIAPGTIIEINRIMGINFGTMAVHLSISQIHGLLDAVRNLVLEWALKLERAGINGEGMSFNREEKQLAKVASTTINVGSIGSMVGNLGANNVSGEISAAGISVNDLSELIKQITPHLSALKVAGADSSAMDESLSELAKQVKSEAPDQKAARGALADLRNALSGAAGSLIASGAITMITMILGG